MTEPQEFLASEDLQKFIALFSSWMIGWGVAQISFSSGGSPIEKFGDSVVLFHTPYGHDAVGPFDGPAAATSFEPICHHVLARPLNPEPSGRLRFA